MSDQETPKNEADETENQKEEPVLTPEEEKEIREEVKQEAKKRRVREITREVMAEFKERAFSFIPGYGLLPFIKWGFIGLASVFGAAVLHYGADEVLYGDKMNETLENTAVLSGKTCGLDKQDRQMGIYNTIHHDVRTTTRNTFSNIPFVGWAVPSYKLSWLPQGQAYEALYTADKYDIAMVPTGTARGWMTMKDGVEAVIYRENGGTPVMAYRTMNIDGFQTLMAAVEKQGGVEDGALVLRYNEGREQYETISVPPGETAFTFSSGIGTGTLAENPCFSTGIVSETMTGMKDGVIDAFRNGTDAVTDVARDARDTVTQGSRNMLDKAMDLLPSWGGSDEEDQPQEVETPTPPAQAPL